MPLSDHEQRMLDQIESALYAEDPKFASSVRGGSLRAPSARRRLQGAALFVIGLAMLVVGVAVPATMIGGFPVVSVVGFIVMFGGVVFAITGGRRRSGPQAVPDGEAAPRSNQKKKNRNSGSFTSRMEDRFRRRFDQ
jgi:cytochrome c biogenesis protein CcdA